MTSIDKQETLKPDGIQSKFQNLTLKTISGPGAGQTVRPINEGTTFITDQQFVLAHFWDLSF